MISFIRALRGDPLKRAKARCYQSETSREEILKHEIQTLRARIAWEGNRNIVSTHVTGRVYRTPARRPGSPGNGQAFRIRCLMLALRRSIRTRSYRVDGRSADSLTLTDAASNCGCSVWL